jgi:cysteinyl-tRNA synthetase
MNLYNTLSRAVEPLVPLDPAGKRVSLYVCGPTIYNYGHIGNFRTYVAVDLLRRTLRHFGFAVDHVMQFTDVDDKTIRGAREKNLPLRDFTALYRRAFLEDAATLRIETPERTPNATDHIPEMISLIEKLVAKGAAYLSEDGSVYFRLASFPRYGCLCHLDLQNLVSGARVNQDEYEKEGVGDFVLWKKWVAADGDVGWDSPWGKGRPGWHIECSALSMEHLGPQIDIHGGGTDLRFPHHENEIAQSESVTGKTFVGHWFHVEHLLVDGQKMSKSLGNMYTVRDVLARGFTGRELRFALLSGAHYSKNLNFTWQGMEDAKTALARIDEWKKRLLDFRTYITSTPDTVIPPGLEKELREAINGALANDLNVNDALGHLFAWVRTSHREIDQGQFDLGKAEAYLEAWENLDAVLGLGEVTLTIPAEVQALLNRRAAARQGKDFSQSDALRKEIETLGWRVKDTSKGQELLPG